MTCQQVASAILRRLAMPQESRHREVLKGKCLFKLVIFVLKRVQTPVSSLQSNTQVIHYYILVHQVQLQLATVDLLKCLPVVLSMNILPPNSRQGLRRGSRINTDRFPEHSMQAFKGVIQGHAAPGNFLHFNSQKSPFLGFRVIQKG